MSRMFLKSKNDVPGAGGKVMHRLSTGVFGLFFSYLSSKKSQDHAIKIGGLDSFLFHWHINRDLYLNLQTVSSMMFRFNGG